MSDGTVRHSNGRFVAGHTAASPRPGRKPNPVNPRRALIDAFTERNPDTGKTIGIEKIRQLREKDPAAFLKLCVDAVPELARKAAVAVGTDTEL